MRGTRARAARIAVILVVAFVLGCVASYVLRRSVESARAAAEAAADAEAMSRSPATAQSADAARSSRRTAAPKSESEGDADRLAPREEFSRVAEAIRASRNVFLGFGQLDDLRAALAAGSSDPVLQCERQAKLAREFLRVGELDQALAAIEAALALAEANPILADDIPALRRQRGVIWMRTAEQQNCVAGHCAASCIFPLAGDGMHRKAEPARRARADFLVHLASDPAVRIESQWLAMIMAMAVGENPQSIPERDRLDQRILAAEVDCGRFIDVAHELGVNTLNLAGGSVIQDFDGDGYLDIIVSGMSPTDPLQFYRNLGDGRFEERSAAAGLADQWGGLNCNSADYDNDGDQDLLVLRGGWLVLEGRIRNSLLRNNGDGTFSDVTHEAGLAGEEFPTQAAVWGDFDNDGDLDLYVVNESLIEADPGRNYPAQLYRNNGDGTFTDIARQAGVTNDRFAKGVAAGDIDNDGDLDIYVSNFSLRSPQWGANRLYRNNGDGTFTDVAATLDVTEPMKSFATWFFDYDNDGWLDLFVCPSWTRLADWVNERVGLPHAGESPRLYRNDGRGRFVDATRQAGVKHPYSAMGSSFGDLNNDGWLDIYLGTGGPDYEWLVPNVLLINQQGRQFADATTSSGTGHLQKGHGVSIADWDNDGDSDLYAALGGAFPGDRYGNALFLNPGHGNRFLSIELEGTRSNRAGVGARIDVAIHTAEGLRHLHRTAGQHSSFGSLPARLEIGLGSADAIESIEIWWPASGIRQTLREVPLDARIRVREGAEGFTLLELRRIEFVPRTALDHAATAQSQAAP